MNFFSKNKFVFWVLMFLVVINLTVLITFMVLFSRKSDAVTQQTPEKPGMALQKELVLTPSQSEHVDVILADYKKATDPVKEAIRGYRALILDELAIEKPDTLKVNHYADSICYMQRQMQKASVKQYMALKEICNPAQCQRLSSLYFELYGFQGQGKGMGRGMGRGQGMMHRFGWGQKNNGREK
ncbi:MAG: periplasmic heavy metal sensor [Bacteroidota bacterium]